MIAVGTIVRDTNGREYRVDRELGTGGQGTAFAAADVKSGKARVAKVYHPAMATRDACKRLELLKGLNLSACSPALCAPFALLEKKHGLGAVQPMAEGVPLEDLFANPTYGLMDALGIGLALCRGLAVAEGSHVAHGDLGASNIMVVHRGGHYEVFMIDWDNFAAPGAPAPMCRGQDLYAAPELLIGSASASIESDRFALGILMSEIVFRRHPFTSAFAGDVEFAEYVKIVTQARWLEDPADGRVSPPKGSLPVGVLSRDLHALFRRALQVDPKVRPSAGEWVRVLGHAIGEVYVCDGCSTSFINEGTRLDCPQCRVAAKALALDILGRDIVFNRATTNVGRDDLGGDPTISRDQAQFTRHGFALKVRNVGRNSIITTTDGGRRELTTGGEDVLVAGDRVMFGPGVDGSLKEAGR